MKNLKLMILAITLIIGIGTVQAKELPQINYKTTISSITFYVEEPYDDDINITIYTSDDGNNFNADYQLTAENISKKYTLSEGVTKYYKIYDTIVAYNLDWDEARIINTDVEPEDETDEEVVVTPEETTPDDNSDNTPTEEGDRQNPETGSFLPTVTIITLFLAGTLIIYKKSKRIKL